VLLGLLRTLHHNFLGDCVAKELATDTKVTGLAGVLIQWSLAAQSMSVVH
jgi:hypothetical protein